MKGLTHRQIKKMTYLGLFVLLFLSSLVSFALPPEGSPPAGSPPAGSQPAGSSFDPDAVRKYLEVLLDDPTLEFCYEKIFSLSERPAEIAAFVAQELEERTQTDPDSAYEFQILKTYFLFRAGPHEKESLSQTRIDRLKALSPLSQDNGTPSSKGTPTPPTPPTPKERRPNRVRAYNDLLMEMQISLWQRDPASREKLNAYYWETVLPNWQAYLESERDHQLQKNIMMKAILAFYFEESKEGIEARKIFKSLLLQIPDNMKAILHLSLIGDLDQPYVSKKKLLCEIEAAIGNREDEIQLRTERLRWEGSALRKEQITLFDHEWDQYVRDAFREIDEMRNLLLPTHWRQDELSRLESDFRAISADGDSIRIYRLAKEIAKEENEEVKREKIMSLVEDLFHYRKSFRAEGEESPQILSLEEYAALVQLSLGGYWQRSLTSVYIDQLKNNLSQARGARSERLPIRLAETLRNPELDVSVKCRLLSLLKEIGDNRVAAHLVPLLNDKDQMVRFAAADLLKTFQDVRFLMLYIRLLQDPRPNISFGARAELLRLKEDPTITDPKIHAVIEQILKEYPVESLLRQGGPHPIYSR
jgi:hypothetical protein